MNCKVYTITNKKTGVVEYVGETELPNNKRFNCHVANSKSAGSGKFAGRRHEVEMNVVKTFNTKQEAYAYQCELQKYYGFETDLEKLNKVARNENGQLHLHRPEVRARLKNILKEKFGVPVIVYEKKTGVLKGEYRSINEACDAWGIDRRNGTNCLNGIRYKSANGYILKYK